MPPTLPPSPRWICAAAMPVHEEAVPYLLSRYFHCSFTEAQKSFEVKHGGRIYKNNLLIEGCRLIEYRGRYRLEFERGNL